MRAEYDFTGGVRGKYVKAAVLWTGGKDSALALHEARAGGIRVAELVTFAPPGAKFLAHPISVMRLQAEAMGLPHRVVEVREPFAEGYRAAIADLKERHGIARLITGDIDLVDGLPNFIRQCCEGLRVDVLMPLWQRGRRELLDSLIAAGFEVILSCVKQPWFTPDWLGRVIDGRCVADFERLRAANGLEICGENGEYHTLVLNAPGFSRRIEITRSIARIQGELMHLEIGQAELVDRNLPRPAERLELIEPTESLRDDFMAMVDEYAVFGDSQYLFAETPVNFDKYLRDCREHPQGINLPAGWIPYSRYWLVRNGTTIVATSSLRHKLNESLMHEGGHIGYGTRPSCRRRGYGAEICRQTLAQARKMGISPILVTCDADNTGSWRILEANGGRLENQVISSATGKLKNRYGFD